MSRGTAGGQALLEYRNGAPFCYTGTNASHANPFGWSGHWTFHGENGDIRRDAGHLQLFRKGECVEDCQLQDLHPGLIEDDRLQFDTFADALSTGKDREWLQESTLGTWILMEACNTSARTGTRVDVEQSTRKIDGSFNGKVHVKVPMPRSRDLSESTFLAMPKSVPSVVHVTIC